MFHEVSGARQKTEERILVSRDVSCQTSDCEVIPIKKNIDGGKQKCSRSPSAERSRRRAFYDHRRATDSIMSSPSIRKGEGNCLTVRKLRFI